MSVYEITNIYYDGFYVFLSLNNVRDNSMYIDTVNGVALLAKEIPEWRDCSNTLPPGPYAVGDHVRVLDPNDAHVVNYCPRTYHPAFGFSARFHLTTQDKIVKLAAEAVAIASLACVMPMLETLTAEVRRLHTRLDEFLLTHDRVDATLKPTRTNK